MLFFVLPLWCAEPQESGAEDKAQRPLSTAPAPDPYHVIVQFKAVDGGCYQVRWDVFGVLYDKTRSADELLEEQLSLCGDEPRENFVLNELLKRTLNHCLCAKTYVDYPSDGDTLPLTKDTLSQMFPEGEDKVWGKSSVEYCEGLCAKDIRIVFGEKVLYCQPREAGIIGGGLAESLRAFREVLEARGALAREKDEADAFYDILLKAVKDKMREVLFCFKGAIAIRCVTSTGVKGIGWTGYRLSDGGWPTLVSIQNILMHDVLRGTSAGYQSAGERHYAFPHRHLTRVLRKFVSLDIKGEHTELLPGEVPLQAEDIKNLPELAWRFSPEGKRQRSAVKGSCTIQFPLGVLEGVPFACECAACNPATFEWGCEACEEFEERSARNYYTVYARKYGDRVLGTYRV